MDDLTKPKGVADFQDAEASPTTRLLKKKPEGIQGETTSTTPLTNRLADISALEPEEGKTKSGKWVIIGIVAVFLVAAGIGAFYFLHSEQGGIFSGGGSGIDGSGTDSMNANIVQGSAVPSLPADRPTSSESRSAVPAAPAPSSTASQPAQPTAAEPAPASSASSRPAPPPEPARPTVQPARVDKPTSTIAGGSDAAPSIGDKTTPAPAPSAAPAPASSPTPTPAAPASSSSLEAGFTLSEQTRVKEGDLVPLTADVIKPEISNRVQPRMPPLAQQMRKSGQVIVRVLVDENGNVADARLVSETPKNFGFGKAALDAANNFKYKPARKGNVRVKVWDTIFFTFR
jgi:TonB family protein